MDRQTTILGKIAGLLFLYDSDLIEYGECLVEIQKALEGKDG